MATKNNKSRKIRLKTLRDPSNKKIIKPRKFFEMPYAKLAVVISSIFLVAVGIITLSSKFSYSKTSNIGESPTVPNQKNPTNPIKQTPIGDTSNDGIIDPITGRKWWRGVNPQGVTYKITHMHLVLAWTSGVCKYKRCWEQINKRRFYVHGLWPVNLIGRHKLGCNISYNPKDQAEPFRTLGNELMQILYVQWPSYERELHNSQEEGSRHHWKHQYEKHGACAEEIGLSLKDYFELVLELTELNIERSLSTANMIEGPPESEYTAEQFRKALEPDFGTTNLQLACQGGTDYLTEIILCIDAETKKLGECPIYQRRFKCKSDTVSFVRI